MFIDRILVELRAERDKLDRVITQLEGLMYPTRRSTRGRKSMGEAERRDVSVRMKRYWASRRKARG